jgi:hypothetical protein
VGRGPRGLPPSCKGQFKITRGTKPGKTKQDACYFASQTIYLLLQRLVGELAEVAALNHADRTLFRGAPDLKMGRWPSDVKALMHAEKMLDMICFPPMVCTSPIMSRTTGYRLKLTAISTPLVWSSMCFEIRRLRPKSHKVQTAPQNKRSHTRCVPCQGQDKSLHKQLIRHILKSWSQEGGNNDKNKSTKQLPQVFC